MLVDNTNGLANLGDDHSIVMCSTVSISRLEMPSALNTRSPGTPDCTNARDHRRFADASNDPWLPELVDLHATELESRIVKSTIEPVDDQ